MSDMPVDYIHVYQDAIEEWRWTAYAGNNEKLADSGEGYSNEVDCVNMVSRMFPGVQIMYAKK
jgi:uncharacterized protein YegP (UPF0339 family)